MTNHAAGRFVNGSMTRRGKIPSPNTLRPISSTRDCQVRRLPCVPCRAEPTGPPETFKRCPRLSNSAGSRSRGLRTRTLDRIQLVCAQSALTGTSFADAAAGRADNSAASPAGAPAAADRGSATAAEPLAEIAASGGDARGMLRSVGRLAQTWLSTVVIAESSDSESQSLSDEVLYAGSAHSPPCPSSPSAEAVPEHVGKLSPTARMNEAHLVANAAFDTKPPPEPG
jgi:hypothetical protein